MPPKRETVKKTPKKQTPKKTAKIPIKKESPKAKPAVEEKKHETPLEEPVDDDESLIEEDGTEDGEEPAYLGEEVDFTEKMLEMYQSQIKFHIFDPKTYKNETHKEIVIVHPQNRITSEYMTKFEYTEIVSQRARQIENGSGAFVDIGLETDPIKMAEMEILQKKCPLSIRRMYNDYIGEIWQVNEMAPPVY